MEDFSPCFLSSVGFWEPCLCSQVLSESFRMDYCRLWQALIKADMKRVQKYSRRLGAGDLYPLFACMLTARSWESVNRGIDQSPVSASEVGLVCPSLTCALASPQYLSMLKSLAPLIVQQSWAIPGSSVAISAVIADLEKSQNSFWNMQYVL